jgi:hypothetical protein
MLTILAEPEKSRPKLAATNEHLGSGREKGSVAGRHAGRRLLRTSPE